MRLYMDRHKFLNTTTADLWAALGDASGKPVVALAAGWTEQPGFPLVFVSATGEGDDRLLHLRQARFSVNDPHAAALTWKVPVTLANTAKLATPTVTLLEDQPLAVRWPAGAGTAKANVGNTGFYRVLYDEELTDALLRELTTLPVADQLNLLGDAWALVEAGRQPAIAWLNLVEKLHASPSQPIWEHIIEKLVLLDRLERNQAGRRAFQAWAVQLLQPKFAQLGWEAKPGESTLDTTLRARLVAALGRYGDRAVIAECLRRFQVYVTDPASLPGNLRGPVLEVVGRHATRETFDQLHALARNARTTEEKRRAYSGMQAAIDPVLAQEMIALSLSNELSATETARNLAAVAANEHPDLAWDFARQHADALLAQTTYFGRNEYLPNIAQYFTDGARADELEAFVREHQSADFLPEMAKGADVIRLYAAVKQRELPAIDAWVKERVKLPE
jgi:aminopeptidase N